jgi:hypothetical protein
MGRITSITGKLLADAIWAALGAFVFGLCHGRTLIKRFDSFSLTGMVSSSVLLIFALFWTRPAVRPFAMAKHLIECDCPEERASILGILHFFHHDFRDLRCRSIHRHLVFLGFHKEHVLVWRAHRRCDFLCPPRCETPYRRRAEPDRS